MIGHEDHRRPFLWYQLLWVDSARLRRCNHFDPAPEGFESECGDASEDGVRVTEAVVGLRHGGEEEREGEMRI